MANYATLKAAIAAAIRENGNNEISGNLLQQQLLAMVNSLGVGYQYAGIATPAINPGTPDQNVFYLASTAGTYTNFGGLVLADGEIAILKYNGAWSKDSTGAASLEIVNQLGQEQRFYAKDFDCFQMYETERGDRIVAGQLKESAVFRSFLSLKLLGFEDGTYMLESINRTQGVEYRYIWDKLVDGSWVRYADFDILSNVEIVAGGVNVFNKTLANGKRMIAVIDFSNYPTNVAIAMPTPIRFVVKSSCILPDGDYMYGNPDDFIKDGDLTIDIVSDNIANPNNISENKGIASMGQIANLAGWAMVAIPVTPGQQITAGGFTLGRTGYYAFYNNDSLVSFDVFDDPQGTTTPLTVTVPADTNMLYIDIKTSTEGSEYANLRVNIGATLKPYDAYKEAITEIKQIPLIGEPSGGDGLSEIIADLPVSDGSTIASGYAYIDSTDRTVKVKA